eukprot:363565-Chlamydomonas_euryale.AAC.6
MLPSHPAPRLPAIRLLGCQLSQRGLETREALTAGPHDTLSQRVRFEAAQPSIRRLRRNSLPSGPPAANATPGVRVPRWVAAIRFPARAHVQALTHAPRMCVCVCVCECAHALQTDLDGLDRKIPAVFMKSPEVAVLESKNEARLTVVRMHGDLKATVTVRYATKDDTAVAGLDYEPVEGELVFGPGEEAKDIVVRIIDDDMSEPDVVFTVELSGAAAAGDGPVNLLQATTAVTIVDDDDSGLVMFELPTFEAGMQVRGGARGGRGKDPTTAPSSQDSTASVVVVRRHGADGAVSIDFATKDGSAEAGKHFAAARGRLEFAPGEVRKTVSVPLLPVPALDPSSKGIISPAFRLVLSNPMGGVTLGARKECRVVLVPGTLLGDGEAGDKTDAGGDGGFDLWRVWAEQFKVRGGVQLPGGEPSIPPKP